MVVNSSSGRTLLNMSEHYLPRIRIRILSDDPLAQRSLQAILSQEDFEIATPESQNSPPEELIDAMLVDLGQLPTIEAQPDWTLDSSAPVLALAPNASTARQALAAGAHGVLARQSDPRQIPAALNAIQNGLRVVDEELLNEILCAQPASQQSDLLSVREHEVIEMLASGMANKEIAARLFISPHTVKFHVNSILEKLGAKTRTEAVVNAIRKGILTF